MEEPSVRRSGAKEFSGGQSTQRDAQSKKSQNERRQRMQKSGGWSPNSRSSSSVAITASKDSKWIPECFSLRLQLAAKLCPFTALLFGALLNRLFECYFKATQARWKAHIFLSEVKRKKLLTISFLLTTARRW